MALSVEEEIEMLELEIAIEEEELALAEAGGGQVTETLPEGVDVGMFEAQPTGTPLEAGERQFQEQVAPHQQMAKESAIATAEDRKKRRLEGEGTLGEDIENVLFTTQSTESGEVGSQALSDVSGALSLPARALASVFKLGESGSITSEQTKLLEPAITSLNEWANSPEDPSLLRQATAVLGNVALETASDPTALFGLIKNGIKAVLKQGGKVVPDSAIDDLAKSVAKSEKKIEKATKATRATDIKAEKLLVESGGPESVIKRLEDKGIGITTSGERSVPQGKIAEFVKKLKETPIQEFDITDKIESTVVPIKKKSFLVRSLRGNTTGKAGAVADDIIAAKGNVAKIHDVLTKAGFKDPGLLDNASGVLSRLKDDITGADARDLISDLNAVIGDPKKARTGTKIQLLKIKEGIEQELKKAVGGSVPDDALDDYIRLREAGTEKFASKTSKLANIVKRNPDKTINDLKSTESIKKMMDDAMGEVASGEPGLAMKNLEEIDELIGSDMAETAKDIGLSKGFGLDAKGGITSVPASVKAPPKRSIVEGSVVGGPVGGTAVALRNVTSDIINSANKKKIVGLVKTLTREGKKIKASKDEIKSIARDIEEGKRFLMSEMKGGNAMVMLDAMTTAGMITAKQIVERLGKEEAIKLFNNNPNNKTAKKIGAIANRQ